MKKKSNESLISPFSKRTKETASGAVMAQNYGETPRSPIDGSPMLKANAGGVGGAKIPVYIDQQNRICIPVREK